MSVVIIGYFLFRDWKYNGALIELMTELRGLITELKGVTHNGAE